MENVTQIVDTIGTSTEQNSRKAMTEDEKYIEQNTTEAAKAAKLKVYEYVVCTHTYVIASSREEADDKCCDEPNDIDVFEKEEGGSINQVVSLEEFDKENVEII